MAVAARVLSVLAGTTVVLGVLHSAIRTVVLPRASQVRMARIVFWLMRKVFDLRLRFARSYGSRDRVMALYAPLALLALPFAWLAAVIAGSTAIFWGLGVASLRDAFTLSGTSITTLGSHPAPDLPTTFVAVIEAIVGLGLVALLISYLPSIYAAFQRRELNVSMLEVRAGDPPWTGALIRRHWTIGWLERSSDLFAEWERWFADIEETHTSQPALVFFRSPIPGRSWITAAGAVLDSAAVLLSTVEAGPMPQAQLCLRSGYLALRRIADFYGITYDAAPAPGDPISVERGEFDQLVGELRQAGVPLVEDLDQAWRDFAGWRVNYDRVLVTIAGFVMAPYAPWSSDRSLPFRAAKVRLRLPPGGSPWHDRSALVLAGPRMRAEERDLRGSTVLPGPPALPR
ncbi:MAG: hypothetical protein HYX34_13250 [Actinobacteria bacterium]|nr:hypothetical protein [Actinomycetota bacterium]